jgi:predicted pyridoxine 5'-phosphate oxidase superfamily flavin-nucleotide-binding protein
MTHPANPANPRSEVIAVAWEKHSGPAVFATVDRAGPPNAIYVTCVRQQGPRRFVIADNYFHKTRANLAAGCKGTLLFITGEGKSFQLKGSLSVHKEGETFAFMRSWLDPKHPGVAAVALEVEDAYSGAEKLL